jgi:hypothetical protein
MSFDKPLESEADLRSLIDNQDAREGKCIEYKLTLPGASTEEKAEFLADVSSFANTIGGNIVYGMREEAGIAKELVGIQVKDPDAEILRLDNMIRDGVEPRLAGVSVRPVPLQASVFAFVIRVPRSWSPPHRVKSNSRFYGRNSAAKYALDVAQLRTAFTVSETITERTRSFRADRLLRMSSGETPAPMMEGGKVVLHIVPLNAFQMPPSFNLAALTRDPGRLVPKNYPGHAPRFNFDGFLIYRPRPGPTYSYVQVFRNGSIEFVDVFVTPEDPVILAKYELDVLSNLRQFVSYQKELGVDPPLFSLLGVKNCTMSRGRPFEEEHRIDRDNLVLPEVMIENFEFDAAKEMRQIFDAVWNSADFPCSPNYDEKTGKLKEDTPH